MKTESKQGATMKNKIILLESEISAIQGEISKLQEQETNLRNNLPVVLYKGDPERFAVQAEVASKALVIQQPQLVWIADAIAALEKQKLVKETSLNNLFQQQELEAKKQRLAAGQIEFENKVKQINKASKELEKAYWQLKTTFSELNPDFRATQDSTGKGAGWNPNDLINFPSLARVPEIVKHDDHFILGSRELNFYQLEREARQAIQAHQKAEIQEHRKAEAEKRKLQEIRSAQQQETQRLEVLLTEKQSLLAFGEKRKAEFTSMGPMMDLKPINGYIKKLEDEIATLENQLNEVKAEDAAS